MKVSHFRFGSAVVALRQSIRAIALVLAQTVPFRRNSKGTVMPEGFVSIRSYWSVEEARLAKIWLQSEGIDVFLDGAEFAGMAWIDTNATRGAKLMVPQADAERALKLLDSKYEPGQADELVGEQDQDVDIELKRADEVGDYDDDEEDIQSSGGTLTRMRSSKARTILIWMVVIPMVLPAILSILVFIASFFVRY